jgi:hypothetical protein
LTIAAVSWTVAKANKRNVSEPLTMRPTSTASRTNLIFWLSLIGVLAVVIGKNAVSAPQLHGNLAVLDNDSVMRLISIQNWLGGQGWFDTVEYRLVPPEGVLLHWSRYIDALIGGVFLVFSVVFSPDVALTIALAVWPTLLAVLLIMVIGFGTRRLIGPEAACFAMLCAMMWPFTSDFYFLPGRIDHHNVQVLMIVLVTFAIVWPAQPVRSGIVAGLAAAFALAIGLETLPYILLVGGLLFVRANLSVSPTADKLLAAFCASLGIASIVFWLGQTPQHRLALPVCDQLGLPVLSLIAIATVASVVPMLLVPRRVMLRIGMGVLLIALGCAAAWPLLGPCLAGPYGSLPQEVQDIIRFGIIEAQPGLIFAQSNVFNYIRMALPVAGSLILAGFFWSRIGKSTADDHQQRDIIGQLLILSLVGVLASFSQIRLLLMSAAAVPVLVGFVLAILLQRYLQVRDLGDAAKLMIIGVLLVAPTLLEGPIKGVLTNDPPVATSMDQSCRKDEALAPLDAIAPGIFLTPMNLGPALILTTHHDSLSGPYHRSPTAFANGYLPFEMPEAELRTYIANTNATHLMLCGGTTYDVGFARDLVDGAQADWLIPVSVEAGDLMVFEIK